MHDAVNFYLRRTPGSSKRVEAVGTQEVRFHPPGTVLPVETRNFFDTGL